MAKKTIQKTAKKGSAGKATAGRTTEMTASKKTRPKTTAQKKTALKMKKTTKKVTASQPAKTKKTERAVSKRFARGKAEPKKSTSGKVARNVAPSKPETRGQQKHQLREKKLQDIKKMLLEQRSVILCEAEEALNSLPGQTTFPDLGDQASAEIDRNFMLRLREREQRLLKKIEEAIEKIESGSFGTCEVCGQEIDLKRLEARPVTTMCIYCKTEQEEEEKIRGF
jgi:DnaK suppressor protein